MTDKDDTQKAVLITGASYGVGAASALAFARAGYNVAITATRLENLKNTLSALSKTDVRVASVELELSSQSSIEAALGASQDALGRLDVLINNAGIQGRTSALEIGRDEWSKVFGTNLDGTFFMSQSFARQLRADNAPGSIVNITSVHAIKSRHNRLLYGVSKAAINHLTRMLSIEWADYDIRVNAIAPGRMLTNSPMRAETENDPNYIEKMVASIPLKRLPQSEEVAKTALFLASDAAASITGQVIVIDGGLTVS